MGTRSSRDRRPGKVRSGKTDSRKIPSRKTRAHNASGAPARASSQAAARIEIPTLRRFRAGYRWGVVELEPYKLRTYRGGQFRGHRAKY
jgi:hypothetical protein